MSGDADEARVEGLICDFVGGAVGHAFRAGGGRGRGLAKAAGLRRGKTPTVVDCTAGLGRDAFLLASLGCDVTMIERSPEIHALLVDGMARATAAGGAVAEVMARMTLIHGDARSVLPTLSPEVVVVDPMHPERGKSALVKKEMRLIRKLVGSDPDSVELLSVALQTASNRVVLKWPLRAPVMAGVRSPSHQILGKSTRFDVFMIL